VTHSDRREKHRPARTIHCSDRGEGSPL